MRVFKELSDVLHVSRTGAEFVADYSESEFGYIRIDGELYAIHHTTSKSVPADISFYIYYDGERLYFDTDAAYIN